MSKLKSNIDHITGDAETILKEYRKLISIKLTEKFSLFLGIVFSVIILLTLLLVVLVILSFALAGFLNQWLGSEFWGHLMVAGLYLLIVTLLIVRMVRSNTPLLSGLFVRFMVFILDIDLNSSRDLKGLRAEKDQVKEKLEMSKEKLKSDFQLLKYSLLDAIVQSILGIFTRKKKPGKPASASRKTRSTPKKKAKKGS